MPCPERSDSGGAPNDVLKLFDGAWGEQPACPVRDVTCPVASRRRHRVDRRLRAAFDRQMRTRRSAATRTALAIAITPRRAGIGSIWAWFAIENPRPA